MGRHRVEDDAFATAPLARVRPRPFWARIWGNPLSLAAAGLALSIVVVIAAWFFVGGSSPSADGVPVAGRSSAPIDVVISTAPEPSAASDEPSSSPSPRRSPSATPSPSASPSVRPTEPATPATFTVEYSTGSAWNDGFIAQFTVTNTSTVSGRWVLTATFPDGIRVGRPWNSRDCSSSPNVLLAVADRDLPAGQSVIVGFQGSYQKKPATLAPSPYGIQAGSGDCQGQQ